MTNPFTTVLGHEGQVKQLFCTCCRVSAV